MKILVAGGAGYIGSVLVPLLQSHGNEVDVLDLLWFGNHLPDSVRVIQKDVFDLSEEDLANYEQVIFLAGLSNDPMAEYRPGMNFIQNAAGPSYLAYLAKRAGVRRFVYASSCSVYGYTVNELYDETSPTTCAYPYGISKLQGEQGALQLQDENFSVIALRQGTVCGYSPRMRFDLIVNVMYKFAMQEGRIIVNNPGIWRPIIDIRDTARAFVRAVQADYGINGVFNVAYDNYTVGQVSDIIKDEVEELTGREIRLEVKNIQDFRNYKVTSEKAKTLLGFSPKYSVVDMLRAVHKHGESYGDFSESRYYNIQTFKRVQDDEKG